MDKYNLILIINVIAAIAIGFIILRKFKVLASKWFMTLGIMFFVISLYTALLVWLARNFKFFLMLVL